MSFARRLFSVAYKSAGAPLVTFENAKIYALGETSSPYFRDLTWNINENETWAVLGPSRGRKVLLEVFKSQFSH